MTSYTHGPKRLFSWDVTTSHGGRGGVTDDRGRAIAHVHDALTEAEGGARGEVRRVGLSGTGLAQYVVLGGVAEAWRDELTGAIIWRDQ